MIPENKKIAILHPNMNKVWWAIKMMIFLWNFLVKKWNDVKFYTSSYDKDLFKNIDFEVIVSNKIFISYHIRKSDYLIIWNSPMQFVWVFSKIFFFSKAKILWWHHHYPWYYSKNKGFIMFLKRFLEKSFLRFIDLLIWNSFYIQQALLEIYKKNVKILNPVVDEEFLYYKNKDKDKIFESNTIITYSRWVEWKNIKQIFDTYEFLTKYFKDLKLLVWWEWEELKYYKNKYKNKKNISFLGFLNKKQIISNLEKSNVFLFPSKIDSFWISVLESIFIWVPVVCFDEKWVKEIVQNKQNWYLVLSKKEFNKKTLKILNNKELNKKLWKWCVKTRKIFSYQRFEKQLEEIFLEIRG